MSNPSRRGVLQLTAGTALLGSFALAGCGRGTAKAATSSAKPVDDSPATGTVNVWAAQGDADVLDKVIKPFKAANPDLTVKVTLIPNADYYTKLQAAIAAGKGPDVAQFFPESQAQFLDPSILRPVPDGAGRPERPSSRACGTPAWSTTSPTRCPGTRTPTRSSTAPTSPRRRASRRRPPGTRWCRSSRRCRAPARGTRLGADIGWDIFNGQDVAMYAWQAGRFAALRRRQVDTRHPGDGRRAQVQRVVLHLGHRRHRRAHVPRRAAVLRHRAGPPA